jgi:hypothetical protein
VRDGANPYQAIVERNLFGLKPPPSAIKPEEQKKPDPPKIVLNGITTITGARKALMSVSMPAKPPEPAKSQSFFLAEGERDGQIEVLEIDEKIGMVKVDDFGTVVTLTMDKDGAKLPPPSASPVPGIPGVQPNAPPNPVGYVPPPPTGINPPAVNPPARGPYTPSPAAGSPGGLTTIPTRSLRLPAGSGTFKPAPASPSQQ